MVVKIYETLKGYIRG
ncbi:unnamed protein product, partial [Rotaria sp. Silwood2]